MGEFEIELGKTAEWADQLNECSSLIKRQTGRVESVKRQLMFHGDYRDVEQALSAIIGRMDRLQTQMRQCSGMLGNIVKEYKGTESAITGSSTGIIKIEKAADLNFDFDLLPSSLNADVPGVVPDGIFGQKPDSADSKNDMLETVKKLLKAADSAGGISEAGISKDVIDYIQKLASFYGGDKKGYTGARDWCNLTDSSISLWKGLYDYCADKYESAAGFFGEAAQRNAAIAGLAAGGFGLAGDFFLTAEEKGTYADYMCDVINVLPGLWKSGYAASHIGDISSLSKMKAGVWNAAGVSAAVMEGAASAFTQAYDSYKKYSADGSFSRQDTADTAVDASLAGIYGIGKALSFGLNDVVLGAWDKATGGNGTADMSYIQKAAEGYKILAKNAGNKIGNWWNNLMK